MTAHTTRLSYARPADNQAIQPIVWHLPDTGSVSPHFCDTIPLPERYTMMMVYQTLNPDTAQQLWKICRTDGTSFTVTTLNSQPSTFNSQQITTLNTIKPCIYTMQHSLLTDTATHDNYFLYIGADNAKDSTQIRLYEAAYFDQRLNHRQTLMFQTYLALKYGITLDKAHYISTLGDTLWNIRTDKEHYNRIHGIASDTVYHLYSTHSNSLEDSVMHIRTAAPLPNGKYALIGDDNNSLNWFQYNDTLLMLQRTWKIRTNNDLPPIQLELNQNELPDINNTPILAQINDEYEIIRTIKTDSVNRNNRLFYTITQPTNQMLYTIIGYDSNPLQTEHSKKKHSSADSQAENDLYNTDNYVSIIQNATDKKITINISFPIPQDITILIQDPTGKIIDRRQMTEVDNYTYSGHLPVSGIYLISIYTAQNTLLSTQEIIVK